MAPKTQSTQSETGELSAAQVAAGAYELQAPRQKPEESIWSSFESEGGSSQVANARRDLDYRALNTADFAADGRQLYEARQALVNRGFEPVSGPLYKGPARAEHVPGAAAAEIWARPKKLADEEFRVRLARAAMNETFAKIYYRRCVAEGAPQKRYLPEALEYAMLVHHGLQADVKRLLIKPGEVRDHAAERRLIMSLARVAPVHPHAERHDPIREAIAAAKG